MYKIEKAFILTKNGWLKLNSDVFCNDYYEDYNSIQQNCFESLKEMLIADNNEALMFEKYIFTAMEV
jgi:hypothetical protein